MTRQPTPPWGLVVATTFGVFSLLIGGSFLLRTHVVAGSLVRDQLTDWAVRHDAELHVESMRPTGMFGLQLDGVSLRVDRGRATVGLDSGTLEVRPSLSALVRGRVAVGHVRLRDGDVWIAPRPAPRSPTTSEASTSDDGAETDPPPAPASSEPAPDPIPIEVELQDLDLRVRTGLLTGEPVRIRRAELKFGGTDRALDIAHLNGYGTFPGDVPFSLSADARDGPEGAGPLEFDIAASRPAALSRILGLESPADLEFEGIQFCPACRPARICLTSLAVRAGEFAFQSADVCGTHSGRSLSVRAGEFNILQGGDTWPFRLTEFDVDLFGDAPPFALEATLDGNAQGRVRLRSRFDPNRGVFVSTFQTDHLQLGTIWPRVGLDREIAGGVADGSVTLEVFPRSRLATLTGDLGVRDVTLTHPFVDDDSLELESTRLRLEVFSDLRFDNVSLGDTRIALGDLEPVHLTGYVSRADPGVAFEFGARATGLDAPRVRDTLPDTIALPARGTEMSGTFDVALTTSGHTAYPESLTLNVDVDGDVEVVRESPRTDVPSLASNGPPAPFLAMLKGANISLTKWVDLESLGDHVPRILIAAEDARFYRHDGFDWRGIRNAMVHNLKERRLDRGGSTITQQVAKNLFLTHERTLGRKLKELWLAWRLESDLDKDRILELYLNLVQWGRGVQGLGEAADHYFETTPQQLTIPQMVLLSAIIPGPHLYGPLLERGYLPSSRVEKIEHILDNLRYLDLIDQSEYDRLYSEATWGRIAGLDLTVCRDDDTAPEGAPDCPSD